MKHEHTYPVGWRRATSRAVIVAILATLFAVVPGTTANAVPVALTGHAVIHSAVVDESESTFSYDISYHVDTFGRSGTAKVVIFGGDGIVLHRGNVVAGGSYRFSGEIRIADNWRSTPEAMTKFRVTVYQAVGYPATIYEAYDSIDTGWRSAPPSGVVSVRDMYKIDSRLFFDLDVVTSSPGGSADEPCGYLAPYGACWVRPALVSPTGEILAIYPGERVKPGGNRLTNMGSSGLDLADAPPGSSLQVYVVGTAPSSPDRFYTLGPVPTNISGGIDLRSTPAQVKRNSENVTLVASLSGPLADFGAVEPGIVIIDQDLGIIVAACPGERVCSTLIPFVEEAPHSYAAIVADFADPENLIPAPQTPSDVLVLPNVGGPSSYELAGGYIPSAECNTSSVADPVNTATGEFYERSRDLAMPCIGPPLGFERTYSASGSGDTGDLGYGWRHNFEMRIEPVGADNFEDALAVDVVQENGSRARFYGTTEYGFDAPLRVRATLEYGDDGMWTFVRDGNATFKFDTLGSLVALRDKNGNTVQLSYVDGKLDRIADDFGRSLNLTWSGERISAVSDQSGRTVTYMYNARGDLVTVTDYGGVKERYRYDSSHLLTRLIAASGVETVNSYDAEGRVATQTSTDGQNYQFSYAADSTTVTDPSGLVTVEHYVDNLLQSSTTGVGTLYEATTRYSYDDRNNISAISDAYGNTTLFQFDERGRKTSAQDPLGNQRRWIYNAAGNLIQTVNPRGTIEVTYEYDDRDNLIAERHADGRTILYTNDERGLITRIDGPGANFEAYTYDARGDRVRVEYADGTVAEFEYDALGRPILERKYWDRNGDGVDEVDVSAITYNDRSQITSTTGPRGDTTSSIFDARGRIRSITDAAGSVRRTTYDELGRVATQSDTMRNVTSFGYDGVGRLVTTTMPNGGQLNYEYDSRGLVIAEQDPLGRITHHEYDLNGRRIATTDGAGRRTSWTYDAAGRLSSQTSPDGAVTRFEYDAFGELSASIDPEGRRTAYVRDALGRVVTIQRPDGATWTYTYDHFGVVSEKDWSGRTLLRTRDDLGRVVSTVDFNGHTQSSTYRDGLVASTTSPSGVTSSYEYDADGRATQVSYSNGRVDSTFIYDSRGWLTEAVDDGGRVRYVYDREGRLKTVAGRLGRVGYVRDAMGNVTSMTYPSGLVVSYEHNAANELVAVSLGSTSVVNNAFDGSGLLSTMSFGNGVATEIGRASTGAVASIKTLDAGDPELFTATYGYDKSSLLTSAAYSYGGNPVSSLALGRDAMGRVSSVSTAGASVAAVTYRPSHEAVLLDTGAAVTFDSTGIPTSFAQAGETSTTLTYDTLGRRTGENGADGVETASYVFDDFDRLIETTVDGSRHRYRYSQGLRVSDRDVSTRSTTTFRWDVSGAVPRLLEDVEHAYIYGMGTSPVAQVDLITGDIEYLHGDLVGSTRVVSDASGDVVSSVEYSAYGEITSFTGDQEATPFLFAGEYRDPTGLYYLRARYLDTRLGQFLSLDPMGTVTGMPYAYTAGDPFMQTDPLGLFSIGPVNVSDWVSGVTSAAKDRAVGMAQAVNPWNWDDMWRELKCGAEAQGGGFGGWFTQINIQANPVYAYVDGAYMFRQGVADGNWYDAGYGGTNAVMGFTDTALLVAGGVGVASKVASASKSSASTATSATVTANSATKVLKGPVADAVPTNLPQKMALDTAKAGYGSQIMGRMNDAPRLVAHYGEGEWVKMQYVLRGNESNVTVHYFRNLDTGMDVEFKFP